MKLLFQFVADLTWAHFFEFCREYTIAGQILGCELYFNMDGKSTIFRVV